MEPWHREIVELHEFFEAYFLGAIGAEDVARLELALGQGFTIVGPDGGETTRADTVAAIRRGHGQASDLSIAITDARLVAAAEGCVIARYVERHAAADRTTERLSTVVFERSAEAPNGLRWVTVHETWTPASSPT